MDAFVNLDTFKMILENVNVILLTNNLRMLNHLQ